MSGQANNPEGNAAQGPVISGVPVLIPSGEFQDQPVFLLDRLCTLVGEDQCCELQLLAGADPGVHAMIVTSVNGVYVRSFALPGHLLVNGKSVREANLKNADDLKIGRFTFKYFENQAPFQPATGSPAGGIEFNGTPPRAIAGRSALVGSAQQADVRFGEPNLADRHLVLFTANGAWHVRDLGSPAGTIVNLQAIRQADLKAGDLIEIGDCQLKWNDQVRPPAPKPQAQQFATYGGMMLGGMPVALPEMAKPPTGFGRVGVTFQDKVLKNRRDRDPVESPPMPEFTAIDPENADNGSGELETPRTSVLRRFPTVPKIRATPQEQQADDGAEAVQQEYVPDAGPFGGETIDGLGHPVLLGSEEATNAGVFGEGVQHLTSINDAAFGGMPITGGEHYVMQEGASGTGEQAPEEIEDFSQNKFWDQPDDEQSDVPLPARQRDLAPPIPPVGTVFTIVGGDIGGLPATAVEGGNGEAVADATAIPPSLGGGSPISATFQDHVFGEPTISATQEPVDEEIPPAENAAPVSEEADAASRPVRASAPLPLDRSPLRRPAPGAQVPPDVSSLIVPPSPYVGAPKTVAVLMGLMILCMAAAAGWIWLWSPAHSTIEGRLTYLNVPAQGTADWTAFEADQRRRLGSPDVLSAALDQMKLDHPHLAPGFLTSGSKVLAATTQAARFDPAQDGQVDLVLSVSGTDADGDINRVADLLRALYANNGDLSSAAAAARKALSDWIPTVTAKQQDLADVNAKIAAQKALIAQAKNAEPAIKSLSAETDQAVSDYQEAEQTIAADETQLLAVKAQVSPNYAPTTQPSNDPITSDMQQQIQTKATSIVTLQQHDDVVGIAKAKADMDAAHQQLTAAMTEAADAFKVNPELGDVLRSAVEMEDRVSSMIGELSDRRDAVQGKWEEFRRTIDQLSRKRIEALSEADDQVPVMREQVALAHRNLLADEGDDSSATEADRTALRHQITDLEHELATRQRELGSEDAALLHQHVGRLIDGARADLIAQQHLVIDALQALVARLNATPPPPGDITDVERKEVMGVLVAIQNVAQAQSNYSGVIATNGPDADAIAALQDQMVELKNQCDARTQILSAAAPANDNERRALANQMSLLIKRVARDRAELVTAHDNFMKTATASTDTSLKVLDARMAMAAINSLQDELTAKQDDLAAMQQSSLDLEAKVKASPDVKPMSETNVRVVWDDSGRKTAYTLFAVLGIGIAFGILTIVTGGRRPADGDPPRWHGASGDKIRVPAVG